MHAGNITVLDGGNIVGFDVKIALNVKQRFAQRGTLAAQAIAKSFLVEGKTVVGIIGGQYFHYNCCAS